MTIVTLTIDGEREVVKGAGDGEVVEGGEVDERMKMLLGKRDELLKLHSKSKGSNTPLLNYIISGIAKFCIIT